jgi:hypothetical protein
VTGPKADKAEDLYALPLSEFTKARNALAKESGDKAIAKLKKPSATAWALNQAARSSKGDVARFLHAAERVRAAPGRQELADLRTAEADVRRAALKALGDTAGTHTAAVNTLLAAAAGDPDIAETLRAGTLTGDEEADTPTFGHGHGHGHGHATAKPKRDEVKEARQRKERERARQRYEEALADAKQADEHAADLEREAADAEDKAAKARAHADAARQQAEAARHKAEGLKP